MKKQDLPVPGTANPPPICYTVANACRVLGIGKTYLYELIASGNLEALKGRISLSKR